MDLTVFMNDHEADYQFFYYHVFLLQGQKAQSEEVDEKDGANQLRFFLVLDQYSEVSDHTLHMIQKQNLQMDHEMMILINESRKHSEPTHDAFLVWDW